MFPGKIEESKKSKVKDLVKSNDAEVKALSLLPFKLKIGLLSALFRHFWTKDRVWSKANRSEPKSNTASAGAINPGLLNAQEV